MSWIRSISYAESRGRLRAIYDRVKGPGDYLDNILKVHGLRPHTLEGHMALYKNVLHHSGNQVPKWLLEAIGVYVSHLNGCAYCVAHHSGGLSRLLDDPPRAADMVASLQSPLPEKPFEHRQQLLLRYARALTLEPQRLVAADIDRLKAAGWTDGQILEVNQVTAYFAYANRTVLGLGVRAAGDILGLSPGREDGDWSHA